MAVVAVSIVPLGSGTSVSKFVVEAEKVFASKKNLKRQLGPMFTTLEGDLSEIMEAIKEAQEAVFSAGALRVSTTIKIDERRDKTLSMEGKIQAIEQQI
ncbi:MTH1187 family thiamine-binding protein [Desulfosporosinus sp. SYSU MS00001]|uniref:MTH1187 family thiamine-binding protein n=1 Tax=Desulfosporosinus sp. SYSU MS00001 TaxID=3416284 RepID=UPI003CE9ED6C